MADAPVGAGVQHRVVRRRVGRRGSWPRRWPSPSPGSGRRVPSSRCTPTGSAGCRPSRSGAADTGPTGWRIGGQRVTGQERRRGAARTATGPTPGPPPPWGMQNVLCRLRWLTSAPKRTGLGQPDEGVEVGTVDVHLAAGVVDGVADLADRLLEHAVRRRVRDHDPGEAVADGLELGAQVVDVDVAAVVAWRRRRRRARPSPRWPRSCRGHSRGSGRWCARRHRASGGRRGWPADRRARPGCRRWAAR